MDASSFLRRILLLFTLLFFVAAGNAQEFLAPEKAFVFKANIRDQNTLVLTYKIDPDYYMYQERFGLEAEGAPWPLTFGEMPPAIVDYDPTFDEDMALYYDAADLTVELPSWPEGDANSQFVVNVISQGCAKAGLCYPPMTSRVVLEAQGEDYKIVRQQPFVDPFAEDDDTSFTSSVETAVETTESSSWWDLWQSGDDTSIADALVETGVIQILALFFLLGLLLAFTPCVLPMVPVLSALIVGQAETITRRQGFVLSFAYVAGMSVVYTILGVLAGISGASLAAWLQTPWVLTVFAILLAAFALAMFDVIRIQMPAGIQERLSQKASSMTGGRITVAAVTGAVSALILGPCVAAPLAGALLYISYTGDYVLGGGALFAMSWGMGVPLLLVGASAGSILPKAGNWMEGVKTFFGMLLLATAWWMMDPVVSGTVYLAGWVFLAFLSAVLLGLFEPLPSRDNPGVTSATHLRAAIRKTFGLLLGAIGLVWLIGLASGGESLVRPLDRLIGGGSQVATGMTPVFERVSTVSELEQRLQASDKPVILDFYADWCVSCKEMEVLTFSDPEVQQRMQGFLLLQADVTANTRDDRDLLRKFDLFGPPGIIFFRAGGDQLDRPRVVGFQNAQRFSQTLDEVLTADGR